MSMILGLAVTQLLKGAAQLYRTRARVRTYWLHWAWVLFLVVLSFFGWWTFWNYRQVEDWNFFRFVIYLSPTIAFYFITAVAFPDPADAVVDMKQYYFSNRAGFFGTLALYGVLAGLTAIVIRGLPLFDPSNLFRLVLVTLAIFLTRTGNERVHIGVFATCAVLMLAFILLFHFRIG
jgi:hypothetical protein